MCSLRITTGSLEADTYLDVQPKGDIAIATRADVDKAIERLRKISRRIPKHPIIVVTYWGEFRQLLIRGPGPQEDRITK